MFDPRFLTIFQTKQKQFYIFILKDNESDRCNIQKSPMYASFFSRTSNIKGTNEVDLSSKLVLLLTVPYEYDSVGKIQSGNSETCFLMPV